MRARRLATANPQGRIDVLAYRLAERCMEQMEAERGLAGLRQAMLPLVETVIAERFPAEMPQEFQGLLAAFGEHLRRRGC